MLNVIEVESVLSEVIKVDPYIPIKVQWGKWNISLEETIYWRTGDFKKSLIEIGIASKTGIIRSLTVVCSNEIFFETPLISCPENLEVGTPKFNVSDWPENGRLDEEGLLRIYYSNDELSLVLSTNSVSRNIISGRVRFGLDNNSNICVVSIVKLTEAESKQIKDTLEYIEKQN